MRQPLNWNNVTLALALGVALMSPVLISPVLISPALAQSPPPLEGQKAFGDWRADKPGTSRHLTPADLPKPCATHSTANGSL